MKEFVKMTGAVACGTLLASGVALKLVLNKKFLAAYVKKAMEISAEVTEELINNETEDYLD